MLRAWLQLLRAPNLLTVPGDPIAGYLLGAGAAAAPDARLLLVVLAGLLFYVGGLVMNDWADCETDRRERPDRPIPSGRIAPRRARAVYLASFALGLAACAAAGRWPLIVALLLLAAIMGYNLWHRARPAAAWLMGACRGLNLLLGLSIAPASPSIAWTGAILVAGFVTALTALARHEVEGGRPGLLAWLPAAALLGGFAAVIRVIALPPEMELRMIGAFFFAFALAGLAAWRLQQGGPRMAPSAIGLLISALLPLQAALSLAAGAGVWGIAAAFVLILAWPLNRGLARSLEPS